MMERIGVSKLRGFNSTTLKRMREPVEICSANQPLYVLFPYDVYMRLQDEYRKLLKVAELQKGE